MITTHAAIYGTPSYNSKMQVFGCISFLYHHKKNRAHKSNDNSEKGINLRLRNRMHRIFLENGSRLITTMHASFEENVYPMMRNNQYVTFEDVIGNFNDAHDDVELDNDDIASTAVTPHLQPKLNDECD